MARIPQLTNPAPCEGIACATYIAVDHERTVVMGTPLYVRVCALRRSEVAEADAMPTTRPRRMRGRVLGRGR